MALGGHPAVTLLMLAVVLAVPATTAGDLAAHQPGSSPGDQPHPSGCQATPRAARPTGLQPLVPPQAAAGQDRGLTALDGCTGTIQPGARMTSPTWCTFNFIFENETDLFIGTAGHCVDGTGVNRRVAAAGVGAFGTVVFQAYNGSENYLYFRANDFALIEIDDDKHDLVDPDLCSFGGPTGIQQTPYTTGQPLFEYGWGTATYPHPAGRQRVTTAATYNATWVTWNGVGSGGDSGAPVVTQDGQAYAIHTAGVTPVVGAALEGGPTIQHVLNMTEEAGLDLDLVTGSAFTAV